METAKKITNVNMKRLTDAGELSRIQKGVYSKVIESKFGNIALGADEIMLQLLTHDSNGVIGYIAGSTLLNAFGICSWVPRDYHIASNLYRHKLPEGTHVRVSKPLIHVNDHNAPYLKLLDALVAMDSYAVDAEHPYRILKATMQQDGIDNEKLIWYARRHCGQKTLLKAIDLTLEGFMPD